MVSRWRSLISALTSMRGALDRLERRSDAMQVLLAARESSPAAAAEAYDGLRKQVISAASERLTHLIQLSRFDAALARGADPEVLARMVGGWLAQAGLTKVTEAADADAEALFEFVSTGPGEVEVIEPAYVDSITGRVIKLGRARRVPPPVAVVEVVEDVDVDDADIEGVQDVDAQVVEEPGVEVVEDAEVIDEESAPAGRAEPSEAGEEAEEPDGIGKTEEQA